MRSLARQVRTMETIGRTEFTRDPDDRDPITAMLFYLALRKPHIVRTFWKQATGHGDQRQMLKFLENDFELARWRTAANKNAFVLLSKQRFRASCLSPSSYRAAALPRERSLKIDLVPLAYSLRRLLLPPRQQPQGRRQRYPAAAQRLSARRRRREDVRGRDGRARLQVDPRGHGHPARVRARPSMARQLGVLDDQPARPRSANHRRASSSSLSILPRPSSTTSPSRT